MPNYYTPWEDEVTQYRASDMNAPLAELDVGISYLKNTTVWCEGNIFYTKGASGELAWDGQLKIAYLDGDGNTIINKVNASSVLLGDLGFAYVELSATDDATVTMQTATLVGDAACNFAEGNIVVLAVKAANDELFMVNMKPKVAYPFDVASTFIGKPEASGTILRIPIARTVKFPADMEGSYGVCGVAPTNSKDFSLQKNDVEFGAMSFASSAYVATFSGEASTFDAGDILTLVAPTPQDDTLADIGFTFVGARGF